MIRYHSSAEWSTVCSEVVLPLGVPPRSILLALAPAEYPCSTFSACRIQQSTNRAKGCSARAHSRFDRANRPRLSKAQRLLLCGRFHEPHSHAFGKDSWPDQVPGPQAWLEFDVDNVEHATRELDSQGHRMLIKNKEEPWGQAVSRFNS
jgi:hypothetical protein